ncbi:hypothetical protein CLOP_g13746, partial [Closterium sp. NIES-67]
YTWEAAQVYSEAQVQLKTDQCASVRAAPIQHHGPSGVYREPLRGDGANGNRTWEGRVGVGGGSDVGGGGDIDVALFMARSAIQAINIMGASAWIYWQAINGASATNRNAIKWGLFTIPFNRLSNETAPPLDIVFSKKFFVLKQLAQGSPRGSHPLQVDAGNGCHHCVAAFYHPTRQFVSIFIVNQQDTSYDLDFSFVSFGRFDPESLCQMEMWRTSPTEDASLIASQSYADMPGSFSATALGLSITSIVFSNVTWM